MTEQKFLQFRLCDAVLGLPVQQVLEIIRVAAISPVPSTHPELIGAVTVRGEAIPVLDLSRALDLGEHPVTLRMFIVIVSVDGETIGLVVDEVLDVTVVPGERIASTDTRLGSSPLAAAVRAVGDELLAVVDLRPLVDRITARESG